MKLFEASKRGLEAEKDNSEIFGRLFFRVQNACFKNSLCLYVSVVCLIIVTAFVFVYRRGQDNNWDLLNYHYYNSWAFLNDKLEVGFSPSGMPSYFHPFQNIFAYTVDKNLSHPWSSWSILLTQLLTIIPVLLISRRIGKEIGCSKICFDESVAIFVCFLSPLWWSELGTSFNSSQTAAPILLALWLILRNFDSVTHRYQNLLYSGLLGGVACGLKFTNAIFLVAIFLLVPMFQISARKFREAARDLFVWNFGVLIGILPFTFWYLRVHQVWKSPIFPLYNRVFQSPFYPEENFRDMRWRFDSLQDFFNFFVHGFSTTVKTLEIPFRDIRYLVVVFVSTMGMLTWRRRRQQRFAKSLWNPVTALWLFCLVSYGLWAKLFAYQRYIIAVELLVGLLIWRLVRLRFKSQILSSSLMVVIAVMAFLKMQVPDWGHLDRASTLKFFDEQVPAAFTEARRDYLTYTEPVSFMFTKFGPENRFFRIDNAPLLGADYSPKVFTPAARTFVVSKLNERNSARILFRSDYASMNFRGPEYYVSDYGFELKRETCFSFRLAGYSYTSCDLEKVIR